MPADVDFVEVDPAKVRTRLDTRVVTIPDKILQRLRQVCAVSDDLAERVSASRDWWMLSHHWAMDNMVGQVAALVARPTSTEQIAALMHICHEARIPVTAAAGRSGGEGASVPVFGGVILDLSGYTGIVELDAASMVAVVRAGTPRKELEAELQARGFTLGHWPQSFELASLGGCIACRGAGQLAMRYGKIEDMTEGLRVVLADGSVIDTAAAPRASIGPDLTQLFVGAEGTLGVITDCRMRLRRKPEQEWRMAYTVRTLHEAIEAARRIIQAGADPAVLRCHEPKEAKSLFGFDGETAPLLVYDEGDPVTVEANRRIVERECAGLLEPIGPEPLDRWFEKRNDVSATMPLVRKGFVFDTLEIAAPWSRVAAVYDATIAALLEVPHIRAATARLSHAYTSGGALYFSMTARPPADEIEATFNRLWDVGTRAVLAHGGNLAHHHGIGLNRSRFMREALGSALDALAAIKQALDPHGICNPGKMGLASPFGAIDWP
ncbi:MAG: FAD-binding oxidoreductase [Sphingomonadaceae bacterium]|nr:FAD-binding oxidoreductase [Sphingomonadaceae bacterium]